MDFAERPFTFVELLPEVLDAILKKGDIGGSLFRPEEAIPMATEGRGSHRGLACTR
jgi:hypothetical protein